MDLDVDRLVYLEGTDELAFEGPLQRRLQRHLQPVWENLNDGPCGCAEEPKDPRMAAISDIFSKFKEV